MAEFDSQYTLISEAPAPSSRARWPLAGAMLLDLAIIFIILIGLSPLLLIVITLIKGTGLPTAADQNAAIQFLGPEGMFALLLLQNSIFVGIPLLRVAVLRREPLATIGVQARTPLRLVLTGIGLGILIMICNVILSVFFISLGIKQNQAQQYPLTQGDTIGQAIFFVAVAVLAPIGEEMLFRGYIFHALRNTFQNKRWGLVLAYLVSALLFCGAHFQSATEGLIGLLVPTFVMGLLLAWGANRTGSVIPGIIAHAINNGLALFALIACVNYPGFCAQ